MTARQAHSAALARWAAALDLLAPPTGPCGLCGEPDARHRVADALVGMWLAGEPADVAGEEYGVTELVALQVIAAHLAVVSAARRRRIPRATWWTAVVMPALILLAGCTGGTAPETGTVLDRWRWQRDMAPETYVLKVRLTRDGRPVDDYIRVTEATWLTCAPGWTWTTRTGTCTAPTAPTDAPWR